ncbi:MAG: 2-C-methyl-D-erythritol 4-phosphate cytidylyltransferase [Treponema sp.]|jgi:2-C-methyl-D-erythritol 4-phosphate cytidylyltransferase/2-C-methyl-D-erythritol 4-phosphate cytidylyltransferase/2-C-methyl-D-erythritol 2,4-cyclodiphosphate synthase|nr:2-C-methyl-D-erythritol 4-phosphate cytidylyltransferase [Treponema sp.]
MEGASAIAAVICAAGFSTRMGGVKKEYQKLNSLAGSPTVLQAAVSAFASVSSVEIIVITVPSGGEAGARNALSPELLSAQKPKLLFVTGGLTRRESAFNALSFLAAYNPSYVLIHDGARPWVSPRLIEAVIEAVKKHGAAVPLLPLTDTPKECDAPLWAGQSQTDAPAVFINRHLKRPYIGIAQTPQGFAFPAILRAHEKAASLNGEEFTDDAEVWGRFCGQVAAVPGSKENRKITFPLDIAQVCRNA